MEDFDQKQNDELQKLLQRKFNYLMIIYRSLTQKNSNWSQFIPNAGN